MALGRDLSDEEELEFVLEEERERKERGSRSREEEVSFLATR